MKNFKDKNQNKKVFQSWPVIIILAIVIVIFSYNLVIFYGKMQDTIHNKEIVERKILELENNKAKLENSIENLQKDSGIEENIRENFGLAREGEGVVVIVDDKDKIEEVVKKTFWEKVLSWFR